MTKIALALGGGGARGLAHIPLLQVFDELGLRPHRIAGTSIGAVFAAVYAAGHSAAEIHATVDELIISRGDKLRDILGKKDLRKWLEIVDPRVGPRGLVSSRGFQTYLANGILPPDFDALDIPLKIVATDFWSREEVVITKGDLPSAVIASISAPGFFRPMMRDGRVLVDGGAVNPVPYDVWREECDVTVAIDVAGSRSARRSRIPNAFDAVFNTFQIMQGSIMNEKVARNPPDILIRPDIADVRMFDLFKARRIYQATEPAKAALRRALKRVLK